MIAESGRVVVGGKSEDSGWFGSPPWHWGVAVAIAFITSLAGEYYGVPGFDGPVSLLAAVGWAAIFTLGLMGTATIVVIAFRRQPPAHPKDLVPAAPP